MCACRPRRRLGSLKGRMTPGGNELMITAETVNGIARFQADGLPVVSLYCRVDPGESQRELRARVQSLLDQIRPLAGDRDFDHRHRLSVRADIKRIKDAMGSERWPPGTIAIFSCSGRGLYEEIPLPRRVREQVMVDATPLARPMLAVLGEYCRACVLVLDRESARVWEMYQDEMREVETVTDPLHKAPNTETRPEDRIQNRGDEQTNGRGPTGTTCWSPAGTSTSCRSSSGCCRTSCAARWPGRSPLTRPRARSPRYAAAPRASCASTNAGRMSGWWIRCWSWPRPAARPR